MISDVLILTSFGLIDPILAIFFKENLIGGSIFIAGLAGMTFLLVKSAIQLPFSKWVDHSSYKKRLKWLIAGSFLIAIVPLIYIFAKHVRMIFIAQIIHGIGSGLAYPTWLGLWVTHLDKKQESFEWSMYSTITGLGAAFTAAVGAAIAEYIGFNYTFMFVGGISLIGCFVLFKVDTKVRRSRKINSSYHKRRKLIKNHTR